MFTVEKACVMWSSNCTWEHTKQGWPYQIKGQTLLSHTALVCLDGILWQHIFPASWVHQGTHAPVYKLQINDDTSIYIDPTNMNLMAYNTCQIDKQTETIYYSICEQGLSYSAALWPYQTVSSWAHVWPQAAIIEYVSIPAGMVSHQGPSKTGTGYQRVSPTSDTDCGDIPTATVGDHITYQYGLTIQTSVVLLKALIYYESNISNGRAAWVEVNA